MFNMYCRCKEQTERTSCRCNNHTERYPCRCDYHTERMPCRCNYPIERNPHRYHQGYSTWDTPLEPVEENKQEHVEHEQPKVEVKEVKPEPKQCIKKEKAKKSNWAYWKCVTCNDGRVRFLKTSKCPIPRRGYSITKDEFIPYEEFVKKKTTNHEPLPNEKRESISKQNKEETTSKRNSKESENLKTETKNKKKNGHKEEEENIITDSEETKKSRKKVKKVTCCCSNRMPVCCCQHAHTSSKVTCRCHSKCKKRKSCEEITYSCKKIYTETGEEKFVCKKNKCAKNPCEEETEEYMVLMENGNLSPCNFGQTQIFIIAEESSNNPAIELLPIDPFTPLPPCECAAKKRQSQQLSQPDNEYPRSSMNEETTYGRSSLQNSRKSVESTPSQSKRNSVVGKKKHSKK